MRESTLAFDWEVSGLVAAGILEQLPRFSEYDPGAVGEGSLDPLGLAAVAERIADRLLPGLRARMSHPRFVTLSAVGAFACQDLLGVVSSDEKTTFDIAFEWLVVEALVRYPGADRLRGVPGSQKARRAKSLSRRLSAADYLSGPRNFGFTGVYRPFSRDAEVLDPRGLPGPHAEELLLEWEADHGLAGFVGGGPGMPGIKLRREIVKQTAEALRHGRCVAPPTGWFLSDLASVCAPGEARARERAVMLRLVVHSRHPVRDELTALLRDGMPPPEATQREIALSLLSRSRGAAHDALHAAVEFETAATAIDNTFRRLLAYAVSLGGAFTIAQGMATPRLSDLAARLGDLTRSAVEAVARLDEGLAHEAVDCLREFDHPMGAQEFVDALIARHQQIQELKGKRMWIDPVKHRWVVRTPYRKQDPDLSDDVWAHPMRLYTLVSFLRACA
ncbi:hypothetical protein [Dactylosporangium sp. CA-092794]|uniref:hypothetical protein n=1 Tax=Dactylosporangium sp. CA-092794 TaxID=3239929 RepID=UPI003D8DFEEF